MNPGWKTWVQSKLDPCLVWESLKQFYLTWYEVGFPNSDKKFTLCMAIVYTLGQTIEVVRLSVSSLLLRFKFNYFSVSSLLLRFKFNYFSVSSSTISPFQVQLLLRFKFNYFSVLSSTTFPFQVQLFLRFKFNYFSVLCSTTSPFQV